MSNTKPEQYAVRLSSIDNQRLRMVAALTGLNRAELIRESIRDACARRLSQVASEAIAAAKEVE